LHTFLTLAAEITLCPDEFLANHGSCYLFGHHAVNLAVAEVIVKIIKSNGTAKYVAIIYQLLTQIIACYNN